MIAYTRDMWGLASDGDKQGILYFVVLYMLILCLYSLFRQILIRRWPSTRGLLQNAAIEKWGVTEPRLSDQEYEVDSLYRYQVSDQWYQGTRVSPWIIIASHNARAILTKQLKGIQKNEDGTVNVVFNPRNPKQSYLIRPGFFGMAITLAMAVLPLLFYLDEYL